MKPRFAIEHLAATQDRTSFDCGEAQLNRYFREQARQDAQRRIANCFVAVNEDGVAGFFTLAAAGIPVADLPAKRLPRYPLLPGAIIGRLAVDQRWQGLGLGSDLIVDAIVRATRTEAAIFALIVDAKSERAAAFYQRHGFAALEGRPGSLFLPLARAARALRT